MQDIEESEADNRWWTYVQRISEGASTVQISGRAGLNQSTVQRWKVTGPSVAGVRAFAVGYQRPMLEAFIEAEFLTDHDLFGTPEAVSSFFHEIGHRVLHMREEDQ